MGIVANRPSLFCESFMKVGDLVTLSAAGSRQDQNWIMREYSTFGIIVAIQENIILDDVQPSLYKVKWYWKQGVPHPVIHYNLIHHWRYELKKYKKTS
tara:strand:+ start:149 stop:442 length:294 start_codon:yes stop_codon:yes gene_type:complete